MDYYEYYEAIIPEERTRFNFFYTRLNKMLLEWNKFIFQNEFRTENSWVYLFEFIKCALIDIIAEFCPKDQKTILKSHSWCLEYKEILFNTLLKYRKKSLIGWCFLQCSYFLQENANIRLLNSELLKNMDFIIEKGKIYETVDEIYLDPLLVIFSPLYSLSYRNQNNKDLFLKRNQTYLSMCPDLKYDGVNGRKINDSKLTIGFISDFLTKDSSVLRDRMGIIENLDSEKFNVKILTSIDPDKINGVISKNFYERNKDKFVIMPRKISDSRKMIADLNLDVLVYCEIGMAVKSFLLSFSRLAPIQINTWGHSDTSGNSEIDYFISSKLFETENGEQNYSEKLIKLDSLGTYYYSPKSQFLESTNNSNRKNFNLPEDKFLIGCIQTKFKISNEFENIIKNILEQNENCLIYLSNFVEFNRKHLERIKKKLGDNFNRLQFIRGMDTKEYLSLLQNFDIVLDPYPFGGCNTSLEAFDFDIPVVTFPTKYLNGRFTQGFYKLMEIESLCAKDENDYVDIVNKLVNDKEYLQNTKDLINQKKNILFQQENSNKDWEEFLLSLKNKE